MARTVKDLQYLITASEWGDDAIAHGDGARMHRLKDHGWVENIRAEWIHERAKYTTVANLTDRGQELRNSLTVAEVESAVSIYELSPITRDPC